MGDTVFVIDSPLQMLNALEARHSFALKDTESILIIIVARNEQPDIVSRIQPLIKISKWKSIHILNSWQGNPLIRKYHLRRKIDCIIDRYPEITTVFIGDYRTAAMRHIANKTKPQVIYLLDDGQITLTIAQYRAGKLHARQQYINDRWTQIKNFIDKMFFGFNNEDIENLRYYTAYAIEEYVSPGHIIRNRYLHLQTRLHKKTSKDVIFFLGSNLVEMGIVQKSTYVSYLAQALSHFASVPVIYIPHPHESAENVAELEKSLSLTVKRFRTGIEFELVNSDTIPQQVAAFYSSALVNLKILFGDQIKLTSFVLDLEDVHSSYRSIVAKYYDDYKRHYSNSIELVYL